MCTFQRESPWESKRREIQRKLFRWWTEMGCGRSLSVPRNNTQEENPVKLVVKNRVYFGQNYINIVFSAFSGSCCEQPCSWLFQKSHRKRVEWFLLYLCCSSMCKSVLLVKPEKVWHACVMWIPIPELTCNKAEITTLLTRGVAHRRCSDTEVLGNTLVPQVWVGRTTTSSDSESNVSKFLSNLFHSPLTEVLFHVCPNNWDYSIIFTYNLLFCPFFKVEYRSHWLGSFLPVFLESQSLSLMSALD